MFQNWLPPWLRRPIGGNRAQRAASLASNTSSTVGTMVPENAQVVRLLHVGFQRIGHADHRRGAHTRARMHHLLDLVESETRVLHLEPREVVMRRHLAILLGVERALRMAEHLLARQQLGLGGVVELSIRILHERPGWPSPTAGRRPAVSASTCHWRASSPRPPPCALGHAAVHTNASTRAPPILAPSMCPSSFGFWKARVCHRTLFSAGLLLLIRDDQIAVFLPVGIQRFRVADRMHAGRRRFDERVVR